MWQTKQIVPEHEFRQWCEYFGANPPLTETLDLWGSQICVATLAPWTSKQSRPSPESMRPDRWNPERSTMEDKRLTTLRMLRGLVNS